MEHFLFEKKVFQIKQPIFQSKLYFIIKYFFDRINFIQKKQKFTQNKQKILKIETFFESRNKKKDQNKEIHKISRFSSFTPFCGWFKGFSSFPKQIFEKKKIPCLKNFYILKAQSNVKKFRHNGINFSRSGFLAGNILANPLFLQKKAMSFESLKIVSPFFKNLMWKEIQNIVFQCTKSSSLSFPLCFLHQKVKKNKTLQKRKLTSHHSKKNFQQIFLQAYFQKKTNFHQIEEKTSKEKKKEKTGNEIGCFFSEKTGKVGPLNKKKLEIWLYTTKLVQNIPLFQQRKKTKILYTCFWMQTQLAQTIHHIKKKKSVYLQTQLEKASFTRFCFSLNIITLEFSCMNLKNQIFFFTL